MISLLLRKQVRSDPRSSAARDVFISDYDEFIARTQEAFAKMVAARSMNAADIAQVIYEASTDSRGFIKAKQKLSDQD